MNLTEAFTLARTLMRQHGLGHVPFEFDRARVRFGGCHYIPRTGAIQKITLSEALTLANTADTVRKVILHEIAHALRGPGSGHDVRFRQIAREIGGHPDCRISADAAPPLYTGACGCKVHTKNRLPRNRPLFTCRRCGISFRFQRGQVSMSPTLVAATQVREQSSPPATLDEWRARKARA